MANTFNKQKLLLHQRYKQYKNGMITEKDLTDKERELFIKYFGVKET